MRRTSVLIMIFILGFGLAGAQWVNTLSAGPASCFTYNGTALYVGTFQNGLFRSMNRGGNWSQIYGGQVTALASNGAVIIEGTAAGAFVSTNGGGNWTQFPFPTGMLPVTSFAIGNTNLYASVVDSGIYMTGSDAKKGWTGPVNNNRAFCNLDITGLAATGPNVYVGTAGGGIFVSPATNGSTWVPAQNGPSNPYVPALAVNGASLYAGTFGDGVFRSTDNGMNWAPTTLLYTQVSCLVGDGTNIFAGSSDGSGVWCSRDNGGSWYQLNAGLPSVRVYALAICDTFLVAGTEAGVYRRPLVQALPIQLESFAISSQGERSITLEWSTLSETNNYGFLVQKDLGGVWGELSKEIIPGFGTTVQRHTYSMVDSMPPFTSYRLVQVDLDGSRHVSDPVSVIQTHVASGPGVPRACELHQNYPNPFNATTKLSYTLSVRSHVTLSVYTCLGQLVATLITGEKGPGTHEERFDAAGLASGFYFYRLDAVDGVQTRRFLLLR